MKYLLIFVVCGFVMPMVGMHKEITKEEKSIVWNVGQKVEKPGKLLEIEPKIHQLVVTKNRDGSGFLVGRVEEIAGEWRDMYCVCTIAYMIIKNRGIICLDIGIDTIYNLPNDEIVIFEK